MTFQKMVNNISEIIFSWHVSFTGIIQNGRWPTEFFSDTKVEGENKIILKKENNKSTKTGQ